MSVQSHLVGLSLEGHVQFEAPWKVENISECLFYHSIELPGHGLIDGHWDLRNCIKDYLGNQAFSGKRVIDVGAASGYLSFEMEKRGGNIIAFDGRDDDINIIPYFNFEALYGCTLDQFKQNFSKSQKALKNSFWFCHEKLRSNVQVVYGDIYAPPKQIGQVEYVTFGNVLLHTQNPLQVISEFSAFATEKVIITEGLHGDADIYGEPKLLSRISKYDAKHNPVTWWAISPAFLRQFLEVLGFNHFSINLFPAYHKLSNVWQNEFCLVATR